MFVPPGWLTAVLAPLLFLGWMRASRIPGRLRPTARLQSLAAGGGVALAVYPLQVPKDYNFFFGDELIVVSVAQRIAEGAVLYRDVWEFLQPGSFAALAAVFRLFGSSLPVLDACTVLLFGGIGGLLHRSVAHLVSPRAGWLCVAGLILTLYPVGVWLSPHWMGTAAALGVAYLLASRPAPAPLLRLTAAGACLGLTFLVQQHKGVFVAAAVVPTYLAVCLAAGASVRDAVRTLAWGAVGALLCAGPFAAWLSAHGLWREWWYATFTWVLEGYGPANTARPLWFPLQPGLSPLDLLRGVWARADLTALRLFPVVYAAAPVALALRSPGAPRQTVAIVGAVALGVFGTALVRYESLRLLYTAPTTLLLAAVVADRLVAALPRPRRGVAHLGATVLAGGLAFGLLLATVQQYVAHLRVIAAGPRVTLDSPAGRVTLWSSGFGNVRDAATVITALQSVPRERTLFVYPGGWGYGYLSGLRNGTPYHLVLPEYTRPRQWRRLFERFDAGAVDYVVWDRNYDPGWMRSLFPTLPPDSVWTHEFPQRLQSAEWELWVDTPSVRLYRRAGAAPG